MIENKYCILIIDDEMRMTRALKDFFKAKKFHVITANDGQEGLDIFYANNQNIDLILLDIMMPVMDGIKVITELRENGETVPVIFLTARSEEYDEIEGFNRGAFDYVTKPFSVQILLARIENILKLTNKNIDECLCAENIKINITAHNVCVGNSEIELTKREYDLLIYLIMNKNIVLSREKILNSVWGYDFEGDIRTVDTHIKQLRIKLMESAKLIKTIHKVGYLFEVLE